MSTGASLLVVGLDGATLQVVEPLVAAGRLPTLGRLLAEGASSAIRSTVPPMTLPAWSTMLTGCDPGKHGIFDFTARVPGSYGLEFTNSTWRTAPTFLRVLSDRGARVASIAVPTTYPPEALSGVVIGGFDSPVATRADGSFVHPPELWGEVKRRFGGMAFADFQELRIGPGWHDRALESLLAEVGRKEDIAAWLMGRERLDALMVVFGETDTVSHHFWMFHDPASPRSPDHVPAHLADAVARVYARCDRALDRLLQGAGADAVVVVSDHGFGGAGDRAIFLNRFLEERGWLRFREGERGGRLTDRARALALRTLPARAQEQLVRRLPDGWLGHIESRSRYGDLDFARTRAWSDEMNYAATVHLNLAGRDPEGTVSDPDAAAAELTAELLAWEVDGHRVVERVRRREALYRGPHVDRSPDLILELTHPGGYSWTVLPSSRARRGETWRRLDGEALVGGKGSGMNGTHRPRGLWIQGGARTAAGVRLDAALADCVPTVFAALGHAIPDHVDGRVLQGALDGPVRATWTFHDAALPEARALSAADAAEIRRRLQSLGYM